MAHLASHTNVYNTCLRILRSRGYELHVEGELDEDEIIIPESLVWYAVKGDYSFCADNPIELIGLTSIYEYKQPTTDESYWWVVDGENIRDELLDKAFPFDEEDEM